MSVRLGSSPKKFKEVTLPLLLTGLVLVVLNLGLYTRLAPQPPPTLYNLPHLETFDNTPLDQWPQLNGKWQLADGRLLQEDPQVEDATLVMPLQIGSQQPYRLSVQLDMQTVITSAGVFFNMQQGHGPQKSHAIRYYWDQGQLYLICGYVDAFNRFQPQARVHLSQSSDSNLPPLTVLIGAESYGVHVGDETMVEDIPLVYRGGLVGLSSSGGPAAFDNLQVEAWPPVAEAAAPAITPAAVIPTAAPAQLAPAGSPAYKSQFQGSLADSGWTPFAGNWAFEQGSLVQGEAEGYDRGISYRDSLNSYHLRVSFRQLQGLSGGVFFNMTRPDSKLGAHMARFSDDGKGIFWGYFDDQGNFSGQGFAATASPGTASHTLEVVSGAKTYSVLLDGATLAQNIPLTSTHGYIGLTSSNSTVAFDSVEILALDDSPLPATSNLLQEAKPLTGDWVQSGEVITQTNSELTDYVLNTGVLAASYTLDVNLTLPDTVPASAAGGGIIFHMLVEKGKAGATMIRLGNMGQEAMWGSYNDKEVFIGQGAAKLKPKSNKPQHLTLIVRPGTYDVLIDGQAVVVKAPLPAKSGWIGLLSFGGPVIFSDFRLTLDNVSK